MWREAIYLTTLETLHTYGFLKIISLIWLPTILVAAFLYLEYRIRKEK